MEVGGSKVVDHLLLQFELRIRTHVLLKDGVSNGDSTRVGVC